MRFLLCFVFALVLASFSEACDAPLQRFASPSFAAPACDCGVQQSFLPQQAPMYYAPQQAFYAPPQRFFTPRAFAVPAYDVGCVQQAPVYVPRQRFFIPRQRVFTPPVYVPSGGGRQFNLNIGGRQRNFGY